MPGHKLEAINLLTNTTEPVKTVASNVLRLFPNFSRKGSKYKLKKFAITRWWFTFTQITKTNMNRHNQSCKNDSYMNDRKNPVHMAGPFDLCVNGWPFLRIWNQFFAHDGFQNMAHIIWVISYEIYEFKFAWIFEKFPELSLPMTLIYSEKLKCLKLSIIRYFKNHDLKHKSYLSFALGLNKGLNPNLMWRPGVYIQPHTHGFI